MMKRFLGLLLLCATPLGGHATDASFLLGGGVVEMGRGGSGVASPRTALWTKINPAGLARLDRRIDMGIHFAWANIAIEPGGIAGNHFAGRQSIHEIRAVPSQGLVLPMGEGTLGLAMYMPLIGVADFPRSRNILEAVLPGNADRRMELIHGQLCLGYGIALGEHWSAGAGIQPSVTRFRTDHYTPGVFPTHGANQKDYSLGMGFNLGVLYQGDRWSFGAAYQSRNWTQSMRRYEDLLRGPIDLPRSGQAGLACRLNQRLTWLFDVKYIDWSSVAFFGDPATQGGLNWRDQYGFKTGLEWRVHSRVTLMAGYSQMRRPVHDEDAFTNQLTPAIAERVISAGATIGLSPNRELHIVAMYGPAAQLEDSGRGGVFSALGRGSRVETHAAALSLGYSLRF